MGELRVIFSAAGAAPVSRGRPASAVPEHIKNGPGHLDATRVHELYGDL
jgi:hypothetical protein